MPSPTTQLQEEAIYYHALATVLQGAYKKIHASLAQHHSAKAAWEAEKDTRSPEKLWHALEAKNIQLILRNDPLFPPLLKEIPWTPIALYIQGIAPVHEDTHIAIVGTRRAGPDSKSIAKECGAYFARKGLPVVSGLALGIDAEAHRGALEAGGKTIAVLPCGLDTVYPREHDRLAAEIIASGGTLISEYPPGSTSYPSRFIERNRIVSGLSRGVLVIEAPARSGALATARFAIEQNRDVFVVPGPMKNPHYAGSHGLIRDGAELIRGPEDVLQALGITEALASKKEARIAQVVDEIEKAILNCLNTHATYMTVDALVTHTSHNARAIQQALARMVIAGYIEENFDGTYVLNI